jgi:hypothetical protein
MRAACFPSIGWGHRRPTPDRRVGAGAGQRGAYRHRQDRDDYIVKPFQSKVQLARRLTWD